MRMKEFTISRYPPLPDLNRVKLGEFTLVFGKNEEGKTLIIDALIKLLFKKYREFGEGVLRVEESPEGYIILEEDGKEIKIPEKGDLTKLFDISPLEGKNIFIIRDSDLTMLDESEHFRKITDRLTGLRTEEIGKIIDKLHDIGRLTPQGDFLNRSPEWLKSKIRKADELLRKIEEIDESYKMEDIEQLEKGLVETREDLKKLNERLKLLGMARNREKYEKSAKALENLKNVIGELKKLKKLDDEDWQNWKIAERDIKKDKAERRNLLSRLRRKEKDLDKMRAEVKKEEIELKVYERTKKKIDDDLRPDMKNYQERIEAFQSAKEKAGFYNMPLIIFSILLIVSVAGLFFIPTLFAYIAGLFFILTLIFGLMKYQIVRQEGALNGAFEKIKLEAARYKLQGRTIEEVIHNIQKFEDEYSKKEEKKNELRGEEARIRSDIENVKKQISDKEKSIEQAGSDIEEIKEKSEINALSIYTKKLKIKKEREKFQEKQEIVLDSNFGTKGKDIEGKIDYWEEEIASLEEYKIEAKGIKFDEKEESKLNDRSEKLSNKRSELDSKLGEFRRELEEAERGANDILAPESDYLYCQTTKDLHAIKNKLEDFIKEQNERRTNVLEVIDIFEEIQSEEEQRVSALFGRNTSISNYFSEITAGSYTEVNFLPEEKKISVTRKSGKKLTVYKLSAGTYDQLYLTIRLGLGEQLLKGNKGFFIMDDPFVKSDMDRLKKQIKLLKKISKTGWQIIYFTAKEEVKELFESDIKNNKISFFQLPGIQL